MQIQQLHLKTPASTELQSFYADDLKLPVREHPEEFTVSIDTEVKQVDCSCTTDLETYINSLNFAGGCA